MNDQQQLARLQRRAYIDLVISLAAVAFGLLTLAGLLLGWWS